ncbi:MAG TPA: (Fe-S)-binding protein [Thermodesulfobacteriota bacterium]
MTTRAIILFVLTAVAVAVFARNAGRLVAYLRLGRPDPERYDDPRARVNDVGVFVLGQARMFRFTASGVMHALIFWGFIVLTVGTVELFGAGFWPGFTIPLVSGRSWFVFSQDLFAGLVLVGVALAVAIRYVRRPERISQTWDAAVILSLITLLMVSLLAFEAYAIVGEGRPGSWRPIASAVASFMRGNGVTPDEARFGAEASWWLHMATVLVFLNYLPFSKHLHIIAAAPNVYFRSSRPRGALSTPNLEEAETFGVGRIQDFTWKQLLDTYACTECGRCQSACPAWATHKPLTPKGLIVDLRQHLTQEAGPALLAGRDPYATNGGGHAPLPLAGGVISEEVLWACTTCGGCVQECPVFIEHIDKIVDMRRYLVLTESRFPAEAQTLFTNLERQGNPWGQARQARAEWAASMGVKTVDEDPDADVIYWVGCAAIYDGRNRKIAEALIKGLKAAGVRFAVTGPETTCSGDPARRLGNEYLFQQLAQENVAALNERKVRRIITACPHCFNTLKNEYPAFGGRFEVQHHTQVLDELIARGRLLPTKPVTEKVTYHDSCYIGRHNGIYDAPRRVMRRLPGLELVEMDRSGSRSFCCGAGGGRMFLEEKTGKRINVERIEEAIASGADTVCSNCPFCMTMFVDGLKVKEEAAVGVKPLDLAELVARSI